MEGIPDLQGGDIHLDELRNVGRQAADPHFAPGLLEHAAGFDPFRLAGQADRDVRFDLLIHGHGVEIRVEIAAAQGVDLQVLEHDHLAADLFAPLAGHL